MGALHRREREAHPQPGKELEDGGTRSIDQYLCATSPRLDGMGGVHCENADIPILGSADPATCRKLGDSLLHQRVMPYTVIRNRSNGLRVVSEQFAGLKLS